MCPFTKVDRSSRDASPRASNHLRAASKPPPPPPPPNDTREEAGDEEEEGEESEVEECPELSRSGTNEARGAYACAFGAIVKRDGTRTNDIFKEFC